MPLKGWPKRDRIRRQKTSREEIAAIFRKIDRDLAESKKPDITLDWRLVIAYNATLGCATVALRATGYRIPSGGGNHRLTIDSLRFTTGIEKEMLIALHAIRKKRHFTSYDAAGTISEQEVIETIEIAEELRDMVYKWIQKNYPELMRPANI